MATLPSFNISEFVESGVLSVRAGNVLNYARITNLDDLKDYINRGNRIAHLRNCGKSTEKEIQKLYTEYIASKSNTEHIASNSDRDILIQTIALHENLSRRALNVCLDSKLNTLGELLNHYTVFGSFKNLRNCGSNTDIQLMTICIQYIDNGCLTLKDNTQKKRETWEDRFSNSNISIKDLSEIEKISLRTIHVLENCGIDTLLDLIDHHEVRGFKDARNCGEKTLREIERIVNKYKGLLLDSSEKNNQISNAYVESTAAASFLIESKLRRKYQIDTSQIPNFEVCLNQRCLDPFLLIDTFLFKSSFFTSRDSEIIYSLLYPDSRPLEDIGKGHGITRERVRQIRERHKRIFRKNSLIFKFFNDIKDYLDYSKYTINEEIIALGANTSLNSLKTLYDIYSPVFIALVLSAINDNYFIIGIEQTIQRPDKVTFYDIYNHQKKLKNLYLVNQAVHDIKFDNLLKFFLKTLCNKINSDKRFTNDYIMTKFVVGYKKATQDVNDIISALESEKQSKTKAIYDGTISSIIRLIEGKVSQGIYDLEGRILCPKGERYTHKIIESLDFSNIQSLNWTIDGEINSRVEQKIILLHKKQSILREIYQKKEQKLLQKIECTYSKHRTSISKVIFYEFGFTNSDGYLLARNTYVKKPELIRSILEEYGNPMHIDDLCKVFKQKYPDRYKSLEALRGSIAHVPGIITFGRTSTYGLKEWEEEQNLRGGTIRSIVQEYLSGFNEPKHIDEILRHVNQYRDTTSSNVLTNLKLMKDGVFTYFYGGYVGLYSKLDLYNGSKLNKKDQISLDELLENIFEP